MKPAGLKPSPKLPTIARPRPATSQVLRLVPELGRVCGDQTDGDGRSRRSRTGVRLLDQFGRPWTLSKELSRSSSSQSNEDLGGDGRGDEPQGAARRRSGQPDLRIPPWTTSHRDPNAAPARVSPPRDSCRRTGRGHHRSGMDPRPSHRRAASWHPSRHDAVRQQPCGDVSRAAEGRLRPMRGLKRARTAAVIISGHAFIQNPRRGHYELGLHAKTPPLRLAAALDELAQTTGRPRRSRCSPRAERSASAPSSPTATRSSPR